MSFRLLFATLAVFVLIVAGTAYSSNRVIHPRAYADEVSRAFAAGDNGSRRGWTECIERSEGDGSLVFLCEGTRTVMHDTGQMNNVNYFCEFQFSRKPNGSDFRVAYNLCQ